MRPIFFDAGMSNTSHKLKYNLREKSQNSGQTVWIMKDIRFYWLTGYTETDLLLCSEMNDLLIALPYLAGEQIERFRNNQSARFLPLIFFFLTLFYIYRMVMAYERKCPLHFLFWLALKYQQST